MRGAVMGQVTPSSLAELATPAVRKLAPYIPGKPLAELEREHGITDSVKLASNENPLGAGELAREAASRATRELGLYPDGNGFELKQALAKHHAMAPERITLGNGSNDVLVMLAEAFLAPTSEAVCSQYCFAVYPIVTQATGATLRVAPALPLEHPRALGHDLDAMAALVNERTRLVFIANPNNPTGTWVDTEALERFIASAPPTTLVVVDEAYIEYVGDGAFPDASRWLDRYPNLVVTRTFSKAYGLAALRVGYALSHPVVADLLNRVRQPFNVNAVALAAAEAALADQAHIERAVALNHSGMAQVAAGLDRLRLRRYPSAGNFLLFDCGRDASQIYDAMLKQGVIVRPVASYQLPTHLRVTIGTPVQNERMLAALARALVP